MAEIAKFYNRLGLTPVSADPASPSQGEYQESDGTHREAGLWRYDGTEWVQIKGGSGINYLEDAANADSWTDDTNFTVTENTSSPLRAPRDLLLSKAAVDASSESVSIPFSIDDADLAKVLPLSFEYKSDANYEDGDYEIEIYDVTNAAVISNSNPEILANELGNTHRTYFQTAPDSNSYELRIKVVTTSATASSMQIDSPFCGPERLAASQTIVSDWVDFTPTWANDDNISFTTNISKYARKGPNMLIWLQVEATGTGTNSDRLLLEIPEGKSILEGNVDGAAAAYPAGQFFDTSLSAGSGRFQNAQWTSFTDTQVQFITEALAPIHGNEVAVGDRISVLFTVPIVGWESGTKPNEVISGREVSAIYSCDSAQAISGTTTVLFNVEDHDSTASYDTSTGIYTVPESGRYSIDSHCLLGTTAWTGSQFVSIRINLNGTDVKQSLDSFDATITNTKMVHISSLLDLQKGDEIRIDIGVPSSTNLNSLAKNNYLNISKLNSLSSQITPTETVAARYTSDAGQLIPNNTNTVLINEDKDFDTHSSYNTSTGEYTIPVSGKYTIAAKIRMSGLSVSANEVLFIQIYKNGTPVDNGGVEYSTSNSNEGTIVQSYSLLDCVSGDVIDIRAIQNSGAGTNRNVQPADNNFAIIKVGN